MDTYQLKLDIYFSNVCLYGDLFLEDDQQKLQYRNYDLGKVGLPGAVMIGTSLSALAVVAKNSELIGPESIDPATLTRVEVIVDEYVTRRDDVFFETIMPLRAEGLLIVQVAESDLLPIVNNEEVFIPVPWGGLSTIQLIAPDGFYRDPEGTYLVESLRIVVSPEIPQP